MGNTDNTDKTGFHSKSVKIRLIRVQIPAVTNYYYEQSSLFQEPLIIILGKAGPRVSLDSINSTRIIFKFNFHIDTIRNIPGF